MKMVSSVARVAGLALLVGVGVGSVGCAPRVLGATSLQNSPDSENVWIYVQTDDLDTTGVYRCYDQQQNPVCKRANITK